LRSLGANTCLFDVRYRSDVMEAVGVASDAMGGIDVAVCNAGYSLIGPIEEATEEEARAQFDVNVFGTLWFLQAILPTMRRQRSGHIIAITSVSGLAPWAGTGLYTASKYAVEGLCQTLHDEVEPLGINVTNVAPGGLRTEFAKGSMMMTRPSIDDYDGPGRLPQRAYRESAGKEPGDANKAAQAIMSVAGTKSPPLHLLLGSDAIGYWRDKHASMTEEVNSYEALSRSIAADPI